ncbi:hypothetical protein SAMN05444401_3536 [Clostridium amylolyticum]|uniref:Uncharacterized protein n=1 Tax=Clostridium amylolyticum TaxID=1121298 RepID=A0A1M6KY00_9CLOT|nr:hypothetical protein [Clostridium amylolyticum]SHJ63800.1 hypothetical protein SAMN05444401_3536 [Clostridium amylolyticum]
MFNEETNTMTVYYSKNTGLINKILTGTNDMSIYGPFKEDLEKVLDCLVLPYDSNLFNDYKAYRVNPGSGEVIKSIKTQEEIEINKLKDTVEKQNQAIAELSLLLVPPVSPESPVETEKPIE